VRLRSQRGRRPGPTKPIRLIAPFALGVGVDIAALTRQAETWTPVIQNANIKLE
jgi:hypothetical protein